MPATNVTHLVSFGKVLVIDVVLVVTETSWTVVFINCDDKLLDAAVVVFPTFCV
jgi:hypothetical protein